MGYQSADVAVVGSVNVDLVARVHRLPAPGETVSALAFDEFPGGKGSNQAVAASRLGRRVVFIGLTGTDQEARMVRSALEAEGVDVTALGEDSTAPTGRAVVLVDSGAENCIVVIPGANARVGPAHIESVSAVLASARVVVTQLEIPLETVLAAARSTVGTFVLNAAPARALPRELLDLVDVLVVNEVEYEAVAGRALSTDLARLADELAVGSLPRSLVITLGARGAIVADGPSISAIPAPAVDVVDTTGAGDTFIGALADALSRGEPLHAAAQWAVYAASTATGALGATTGMPRADEVLAAIRRCGEV
ncbi:ribokinase [Georgenia thermotolerans]|uniref:Ribokinase n=1 Tax=Georgenia thermotolerans TaxID=527326 RepID=A0A7J5UTS5_9MICO|nr:ribokinase [Georgenia thermotolerans]KAE8765689.1 ribokinase [Georgenia thermotolerans]